MESTSDDNTPTRGKVLAARVIAMTTVALTVGGAVAFVVFHARFRNAGRPDLSELKPLDIVFVAAVVTATAVGTLLLLRRPNHPVGWLFSVFSVTLNLSGVLELYGRDGLQAEPGSLPGASVVALFSTRLFVIVLVVIALICSLTPDGHYVSPRWRRVALIMMVSGTVWFALGLFKSGPLEEPFQTTQNPWALASSVLDAFRVVAAAICNILMVATVASVAVRFRRARDEARLQLLWIVVAGVAIAPLIAVAFVLATLGYRDLLNVAAAGMFVLLPIGAALAVTRYHLYDIDRILSRAVTYTIVSALLAASYLIVVVAAARLFGDTAPDSPGAAIAATLVATLSARPIHSAIRDVIDRRFMRRRYDALHQVRSFVADPGGTRDVQGMLRHALQAPNLTIAYWIDERAEWVSEAGRSMSIAGDDSIVVERGGRTVAAVSESGKDPRLARTVIEEAAPELDNASLRAAIAVQLEEVRASRERIAVAQLEERRRIERDLHDGAQQRLLGSAAQMQAALLNGTMERLRAALTTAVSEAREAVVELRALANGLHPSALADAGLTAALDDLASRQGVSVSVSTPERRRYPSIVEATMWFVACEGIANAIKHASPTSIEVSLDEVASHLRLRVIDDGCGGADRDGRGLRGLSDRVEAAGGELNVNSEPGRGTRLVAVLPCES